MEERKFIDWLRSEKKRSRDSYYPSYEDGKNEKNI